MFVSFLIIAVCSSYPSYSLISLVIVCSRKYMLNACNSMFASKYKRSLCSRMYYILMHIRMHVYVFCSNCELKIIFYRLYLPEFFVMNMSLLLPFYPSRCHLLLTGLALQTCITYLPRLYLSNRLCSSELYKKKNLFLS